MTFSNRRFLLASAICAVLASLPFFLGLNGGFVFDDEPNIINNPGIQLASLSANSLLQVLFGLQPGGATRILPTLSFALDYWRSGGLDPVAFKTTNIAIHAVTTFVLAWFFSNLLLAANTAPKHARLIAVVLTLAWALHPLQVSSVLYVVQRMQTMATLFLVLALLTYLKARQTQIEGRSGRTGWMLSSLFWALAFGCKEDAILLPVYTLALELTVLRFRAENPELSRRLRTGYAFMTAGGAALFLLVAIPHYWSRGPYPGRDFSTIERLLTQGRVLCMYLWEIILPLPQHMPFYYDWIEPSRSLLHPASTLPSLLVVAALLVLAWRLRIQRSLFAFGIFIFFSGQFLTSNIANLELAFEHRNHFPLIGVVLAVGDLVMLITQRLRVRTPLAIGTCILLLALLSAATSVRARIWDSPLGLAQRSTEFAPRSARAWNSLCLYFYQLGGGKAAGNPYLSKAIDICGKGAEAAPYSVTSLTNLIIFKSMRGNATQADWDILLNRLQWVNLGPENMRTASVLMNNVSQGVALNDDGVLGALDIISRRMPLGPNEMASIGTFILTQTRQPERAYPYFERSIQLFSPHGPGSREIIARLKTAGRIEWVTKLEKMDDQRGSPQAH
ncbi:hypothetical protein [Solilutibacter silvestris]|uniref:Uncharacterized protein n=1 Tax=Solilutibacter silvestris TaxID=1645665 RepID=A0A2K1Q2V8_9GAMM|nr:hypothetical protein [Lysobacter silvestris]PNS09311.1 hypothetical protein Lysil_0940 [Lysobacter silvestris]